MFARYYLYLDRPFPQVQSALEGTASALTGSGEVVIRRAEPAAPRPDLELGPGELCSPGSWLAIPARCAAASSPPRLLGRMEGELEAAAFGPGHTQLTLSAHYDPPLEGSGTVSTAGLLSRLADATTKDVLERFAASLESELSNIARRRREA